MSNNSPCGQSWYTPDEDNAWIGAFASGVNSFPVVGPLISGLVPPSQNLNSIRCIPGDFHNETTGYRTEGWLILIAFVLLIIYLFTRK